MLREAGGSRLSANYLLRADRQGTSLTMPRAVVQGGSVSFFLGDDKKTVRLVRAHLEEDAGKSLHEDFIGQSGIDLNRAGTPLLEIVTEPDIRSSEEAVAYAKELHKIVTWIGICDGNMQEGSFRCDANVSVRPVGQAAFGTRAEIKNVNSFRFVERAINYEVERQIELIEDGGKVVQETRLFNPDTGTTRSMRSKEDAHDYRYFPDPDLLPLELTEAFVEDCRASLPELPDAKRNRYVETLGISGYNADVLTAEVETARWFEALLAEGAEAKQASNWVMSELFGALNRLGKSIEDCPVSPAQAAELLNLVADGTLSGSLAKQVFEKIVAIAQSLGGTASGEHGIGTIKAHLIADEISPTVMQLQRDVKRVFDPHNILNPNKKFLI